MKAATKAEIMLDQVTKSNQLIKRLRFCMDPEAVMRDSLERGKNLLIMTFPVVDLYHDPNCDY